jgi:hypothetical protein
MLKDNADVEVLGRPAMSVLRIGALSRRPDYFLGSGGLFFCRRVQRDLEGFIVVNGVLQLIRILLLCVLNCQLESYI